MDQIDESSNSEHESTPTTITIQAADDDLDIKDDSRDDESGSTHTISLPINSISGHGGNFEPGSGIPVQYQLKTENGQVTYRVVQVLDGGPGQGSGHNGSANSDVSQTIIAQSGPLLTSNTTSSSTTDGPFYVMMTPSQEIITPHGIRKRNSSSSESGRNPRDEKRRATHNEVERRRRDKINNWITKLAAIVPDCAQDRTKQGQSKGGILAKACEYINQLAKENSKFNEIFKENEALNHELDVLRLQVLDLKKENRQLKNTLQRHGIQMTVEDS